MRPYDANTERKILSLRRDNYDTDDFWILSSEDHVTLAKQQNGQPCKAIIEINRKDFNKLICWYMREQKPAKRQKSK